MIVFALLAAALAASPLDAEGAPPPSPQRLGPAPQTAPIDLGALPPTAGQTADAARLSACLADVEKDPQRAFEEAMAWAGEAFIQEAYVCAAIADIERGRPAQGASRLDGLALTARTDAVRADLYTRAGHAWMLAQDPGRAKASFDWAISLVGKDPALLVDRASAYTALKLWRPAEEDLNAALDKTPADAAALALRAQARLRLNALDLAEKDAQAALAADPGQTLASLVLGHIREARRTGLAPD